MKIILLSLALATSFCSVSQNIGDFTSITPTNPSSQFIVPSTHSFQKIIQVDDALTEGGTLPTRPDFTGFVPISGSSTSGYLSINSETYPGGVSILDINFNATSKLWQTTLSKAVDFSFVGGTAANCSGTVTPWGTIISSEELSSAVDFNNDSYSDFGWNIEIDPVTKTVINNQKLWAMGNFSHENVAIHSNYRTVYQGADVIESGKVGYLYKFVATNPQNLSDGLLYVYKGLKNGTGIWVLLPNTTATERNDVYIRSGKDPNINDSDTDYADATEFNGIEDVEIGPDNWVYFTVKGAPDRCVYRFQDSDVLETSTSTVTMETFVGNTDTDPNITYDIHDGTNVIAVEWGSGNDNLTFDGDGNLWVLQDGGNDYIWIVKNGHSQANPKVELFGIAPSGSEPTGLTFTPDYKYAFMSIQHPNSGNLANQTDAAGNLINFDKGTTLVIALNENLGSSFSTAKFNFDDFKISPNPVKSSGKLKITGKNIRNIKLYSVLGKKLIDSDYNSVNDVELNLKKIPSGMYMLYMNNTNPQKLLID